MDISTISGLLISFVLIIFALLGSTFQFSNIELFLHAPSFLIVFGGTFGATLANYPLETFMQLGKFMGKTFFVRMPTTDSVIRQILVFSNKARREGLLSLEPLLKSIDGDFLRKGMQLAVDGLEPAMVESIMQSEIQNAENRHEVGIEVLQSLASYAPALGMIGTVIGLIQMLKDLNDVERIGPAMALALITTFYGAILANLVFLPMAGKLRQRSLEELRIMEIQLEGIISISRGDNPRIVLERLTAFQPTKERLKGA